MTENDQEADGAEMGGGSPVSRLIVCLDIRDESYVKLKKLKIITKH